ncbi:MULTISPECIES: hypothetical protein [unclassified Streptomyces]|uniref:hypothetical protein n=1 Tax=unclassified Streptomyces TaxID=2593676 RepID=UPI0038107E71
MSSRTSPFSVTARRMLNGKSTRWRTTHPCGALRCGNIVILGDVDGTQHRDLMAWPHWTLKDL